jgi:hypothetical protein
MKFVIALFTVAFFNIVLGHGGTPGFARHHLRNTGLKCLVGSKKCSGNKCKMRVMHMYFWCNKILPGSHHTDRSEHKLTGTKESLDEARPIF